MARRLRQTREPTFTVRDRLGLNVLPANLVLDMSRSMDLGTAENLLNRRPDNWSSPQSPDELVIQKRGRRRSIVWSPDLDSYKRHDLLNLSSRDRTPIKCPPILGIMKNIPKRRLSLIDTRESEFVTPEKKMKLSHCSMSRRVITPQKQLIDDLEKGLQGLSQKQLVEIIMDLVHMQEADMLYENVKLRDVLLKKMPVADIQPLIQKLRLLKQHISIILMDSTTVELNEPVYRCASLHLEIFKLTLIEQGDILQESRHWQSLICYSLKAWSLTAELPEWKNQDYHKTRRKINEKLSEFCATAIENQKFEKDDLESYIISLENIVQKCEDFGRCLLMAKEARDDISTFKLLD